MKHFSFLILAFCLSASASTPVTESDALQIDELNLVALEQALNLESTWDEASLKGACGEIKLTDAQKTSLKAAFIGHKKAQIQGQADLKIAKLEYLVALTTAPGTKVSAETASTALGSAVAKMATNHLGFANEILFDILGPDQRKPALICMAQLHKHMKTAKLKKQCKALKPAPKKP